MVRFKLLTKRVLIVSPFPPPYGGIASYAEKLYQGLIEKDVIVKKYNTTSYEKYRFIKSDDTRNYKRILSLKYVPFICAICCDMIKYSFYLLSSRTDIIHVHTASFWAWWRSIVYIIIGKFMGKKTILHVHNAIDQFYFQEAGRAEKYLIRKSLSIPDHIITLSTSIRDLVVNMTAKPVTAVYNGVNVESYLCEKKYEKPLKVLFAGFVGKLKGVPDLLEALKRTETNANDVKLTVMGDGEIEEMKSLARCLGIENQVTFTGRVTEAEKISLFKSHHVLALPSYQEGQPISILEGMASGMGILSTTVGSIPEVITDDKNGYLTKPGDIRLISEALLKFTDIGKLKKMGAQNRIDAIDKYNFTRVINDNLNVYQKVSCSQP